MFLQKRTFKDEDIDKRQWRENLHKLLSGNISFGSTVNGVSKDQNIQGYLAEVADTGLANTEFSVTHNLGYVPKLYDVKYTNLATSIFDSGTVWTTTKAFFKSSTANVKVRLFIH